MLDQKIKYIYHYTTYEKLEMILNSKALKFSSPETLNDPFELLPRIKRKKDYKHNELVNLIKEHEKVDTDLYQYFLNRYCIVPSYEKYYKGNITQFIVDHIDADNLDYRTSIAKNFRFLSFSKNPYSLPMWAYYANNYEGVVLEIDLNISPFKDLSKCFGMFDMKYSEIRKTYDHIKSSLDIHKKKIKGESILSELIEIAGTKSIEWKHEEEVRTLMTYNSWNVNTLNEYYFRNKDDDWFIALPKNSISKIICGSRFKQENLITLDDIILKKFGQNAIPVEQVALCEKNYRLI